MITYFPGDACLCNKNIHHRELLETDFEILLILLTEEYMTALLEQDILYSPDGIPYVKKNAFHRLFTGNRRFALYTARAYVDCRSRTASADSLYSLINPLIREFDEKRSGRSYMIRGYLCRLLTQISSPEDYQSELHEARLSRDETLFSRIALLFEQENRRFSRSELERIFNYSSDHMNRVVKKCSGKTLSEYNEFFLLKKAAELLKNTDRKIGDICEELGYTNRTFFNRMFVRQYGMTPREFRK